jgi:hypothetical protein
MMIGIYMQINSLEQLYSTHVLADLSLNSTRAIEIIHLNIKTTSRVHIMIEPATTLV